MVTLGNSLSVELMMFKALMVGSKMDITFPMM